jgi:uncharacterized protein (DUF849 family)
VRKLSEGGAKVKKIIVTAALTGAVTPKDINPHIPLTPEEIAEDAYACWKAGAAVVHLHMRDDEGKGTMDRGRFAETVKRIREHKDCDVILNCTSSGSAVTLRDEERIGHFQDIPEIEMGSYDAGTMNWGCFTVFENSPAFLEKLGECYIKNGIVPEIEIFDMGMLGNTRYYQKKELLPKEAYYQFVLGVLGGMDATVENLLYLVNHLPERSKWSAVGVGAGHLPIMFASLALGCTGLRVGLEDNVIMGVGDDGQKIPASNVKLVQRAIQAIHAFGNEPASPSEARDILGIPQLSKAGE